MLHSSSSLGLDSSRRRSRYEDAPGWNPSAKPRLKSVAEGRGKAEGQAREAARENLKLEEETTRAQRESEQRLHSQAAQIEQKRMLEKQFSF